MTDEELIAAGLLDSSQPDPERAAVLRRCLELGLTVDEIRDAGDDLLARAVDAMLRSGNEQLTLTEVLDRAGVAPDRQSRIARATGYAGANADLRVWNEESGRTIGALADAMDLLGEDAVTSLLRVSSAAAGRISDAMISTFITAAGARASAEDDSGLALLDANATAATLLGEMGSWLGDALIRSLRLGFRTATESEVETALLHGVSTPILAIGFADLVGSTTHAERRPLVELNAALERFELTAADVVNSHGGRVVKFIGDEVMFRADNADVLAAIALDLVAEIAHDATLPPIRSGLSYGMVLSREGDYYGPTVNIAARILKLAPMNGVVATKAAVDTLSADTSVEVDHLGAIEVQGMAEPIELAALRKT